MTVTVNFMNASEVWNMRVVKAVFHCLLVAFVLGAALSVRAQERARPEFARDVALHIGEKAPDFKLQTKDGKRDVQLSAFKGQKPVVLVFGSFT